jgi:HK97 family phage portal protein
MLEKIKQFFRKEKRSENAWYSPILPDADAGSSERLTAVEACVRVLGDAVASLPLKIYRATGADKDEARDIPLWTVLHDAPNSRQTSFDWRRETMRAVLLQGNAYSQIQRDENSDVVALWPLSPSRVTPLLAPDGTKYFRVQGKDGQVYLSGADVLHIHGHLATDGVTGLSAIQTCRNALRLTASAEGYAAEFFENNAEPGGVMEVPGSLNEDQFKRINAEWKARHGKGKRQGVAILEGGMTYKPISVNHTDLQFLELRNFQVSEICRIFGVPNHLINDLSRATFSNIEQQSLEFLTHSLRPWLVNFEQEMARVLLLGESDLSIEFSVGGFLRGDAAARSAMYVAGIQNGWLSANDVRKLENLNPVTGGDSFNFLGSKEVKK